jgi:2-C-methyl-D-erythritol 4-phosphate cytidylyltransferase
MTRSKQIAPRRRPWGEQTADFRIRSMEAPRCYALVPCAGVGSRAGEGVPKQYRTLAGRPMVAWTLDALARVERIDAIYAVLAPDDVDFERLLPDFDTSTVVRCGGATRAASVANGLEELARHGARSHDWVLVHDAARCLVRPAWVDRLIDACIGDAVGGVLALPIADTVKQAMADDRIATTIDRRDKWAAQTPQMFRLALLREALARSAAGVTDEAGAVEALGHAPLLVPGDVENLKVTWPGDFALAERLLSTR